MHIAILTAKRDKSSLVSNMMPRGAWAASMCGALPAKKGRVVLLLFCMELKRWVPCCHLLARWQKVDED